MQRALGNFQQGQTNILVATDIAARGIDVEGISHVINFDMPGDAESYVHRIGRTGRAGEEGIAYSFCTREELGELQSIERLLGQRLNVNSHDFEPDEPMTPLPAKKPRHNGRGRSGSGRQGQSRRQSSSRGKVRTTGGQSTKGKRRGTRSGAPGKGVGSHKKKRSGKSRTQGRGSHS